MNELKAIYPHYDVVIRKNETGEEKTVHVDLPWYEHSLFWWTEGNFGCDCNRKSVFGDEEEPGDFEKTGNGAISHICGQTRYAVIKAVFPDGTEQLVDEM